MHLRALLEKEPRRRSAARDDRLYGPDAGRQSAVNLIIVHAVRPKRWTVSCGCFDRLPGVVILELCWA
jgi:hypothetical protein